ncbi:polysaccharide deacetylase [Chromohalobacter marismortui]|uniref:Polysaccharide deacetylase n=1 Tax=Chromohalobacter marismortui TaxID=42055 RepID=A0A4R7NME2_9GAMM|nr:MULTISPECIES: polysaccharide deacetylase family protein [Chromohalobacter]MCI0509762.1 polysaccharide deacetylase family protein [Chromohalobacter sp.]MCI0594877.1 polysaccharide deacetylase family protein [Chromohalobacter sp.]TDU21984.1 polysaccharide deacetylase [Chromohalobacter marismortui]
MSHLSLAHDVVQRLRGHWRRNLSEPLRGRSAILVIQRVLSDEAAARLPHRAPYCLGPESFRRLLDHLTDHAQIVSLTSARRLHRDPVPRIALTFDGGWRDTAEVALRQLERLALPASVFLTTGGTGHPQGDWRMTLGDILWDGIHPIRVRDCLGDAGLAFPPPRPGHPDAAYSSALHDYLERLAQQAAPLTLVRLGMTLSAELDIAPQTLDPFSVRRLENDGLVRFGARGVSATPLDALGDHQIQWQIRHSRRQLGVLCRDPLPYFAYPQPEASLRLRQLAQRCGVQEALHSHAGWLSHRDDPLALPRFQITQPVASSAGRLYDWLLGHL